MPRSTPDTSITLTSLPDSPLRVRTSPRSEAVEDFFASLTWASLPGFAEAVAAQRGMGFELAGFRYDDDLEAGETPFSGVCFEHRYAEDRATLSRRDVDVWMARWLEDVLQYIQEEPALLSPAQVERLRASCRRIQARAG